jgi:hypothetical protein
MFKEQKGKCAICHIRGDVQELGFTKRQSLCVDHDHTTGAIRGLLCSPCNLGIGKLADDPVIIQNAVGYLIKHNRKPNGKANKRRKSRGARRKS